MWSFATTQYSSGPLADGDAPLEHMDKRVTAVALLNSQTTAILVQLERTPQISPEG